MDFLKITKVENVQLEKSQVMSVGTLHLTTHQLIFRNDKEELWISYPIIHTVERRSPTSEPKSWPLFIKCRNFVFVTISVPVECDAIDVFDTIQKLTCISSISQVYAFYYIPEKEFKCKDGWKVYDPRKEFERLGVVAESKMWRFTDINQNYTFCSTYPSILVVPYKISDTVLNHAAKFRSKCRIPTLSYLHFNKASITRSSQPLVGIQKKRSIQDEKLIQAIFESTLPVSSNGKTIYGSTAHNLIIDARPTANAMANTAMGAGSENTEYYKNCEKRFKGIDNIHVMRESLTKIVETLQTADSQGLSIKKSQLDKSNWLKHINSLLMSALEIIDNVHVKASHVLIHCSDGWDRTAQLTSISELCLDPYYRTFRGFQVLVEKEWVSFGHKFSDRSGHLSNERYFINTSSTNAAGSAFNSVQSKFYKQSHVREISPVFHQFLDCVYQLFQQNQTRFEFNEKFLVELHYHCYSCQFGTFLFNSEKERKEYNVTEKTYSVWDLFNSNREEYLNPLYCEEDCGEEKDPMSVLYPDTNINNLKYWAELFGRKDEELNGNGDDEKLARLRLRSGSDSPNPLEANDSAILGSTPVISNVTPHPLGKSTAEFDAGLDPWKSHDETINSDNKNILQLTEEKETNVFNSTDNFVQNFATRTLKNMYSNVATFASKMNLDLDSNSSKNNNSNENSGNATPTEELEEMNYNGRPSTPGTPKTKEMGSFNGEIIEENNSSTGGQGQFPTLFLRRGESNRNSLSSLGIKTTPPASPYLRTISGSSTPTFEKQILTSPISPPLNSSNNISTKSGLIELEHSLMLTNGLGSGLNLGGGSGNNSSNSSNQPSRSNSLSAFKSLGIGSNSNSRNNSPLSTPSIPSSPSVLNPKELPHPLYNVEYNVDPLSSP